MIFDIVIIGGGIAGLIAAIEAKNSTNKVAIITKGNLFKSNSSNASGGINATLDAQDKQSIEQHIEDTLSGACGLGNKKTITYMCTQAPKIIAKLVSYGVDFDKDANGHIAQRYFSGGNTKRTCFVGDKTGAAIIQVLIRKAKSVGVTFIVNTFAMNLTKLKNSVSGIVALRRFDSSVVVYPTKSVILAGGGFAGIYRGNSTNSVEYTGDIFAIALRAGLNLKNMEFVQFHPTGFVKNGALISEASRGEGAYLINSEGVRFVDELGTRDVVSRAIAREIQGGKRVFLDLRHLPKTQVMTRLPSLYSMAQMQAGIDITESVLEVKPIAHYSMGGIETDMTHTSIKGLFACGECAANGAHGANRLGGNSLLEGAVFGALAGQEALKYSKNRDYLPIDYNIVVKDIHAVDYIFDADTSKNFNAMRINLGHVMFEHVGIFRDHEGLIKAFDYIRYLRGESGTLHCINKERGNNVELISILELKNALEVAEAIILSADKRVESRGSHSRSDYPTSDKKYQKSTMVYEIKKSCFHVWFEDSGLINKIRNYCTSPISR